MEKKRFLQQFTQKQKLLFFGLGLVVLILIIVLIALIVNDGSEKKQGYQPVVDQASGETIWDINEEPEIGEGLVLIGFDQINDYGYMKVQYDKIVETVKTFIEKNYSNTKKASFKKGSFRYLDEEMFKASFEFVLDDEKSVNVTVDTGGSLSEIKVEVAKE